jgi:uncharacterized protein YjiS (DUF1127 family)
MSKFYLATVAAVVVTTSLASNILVVGMGGSVRPDLSRRMRSGARRWFRRFKHVVDAWVADMIASRERQAAIYALDQLRDCKLRDIGLDRGGVTDLVRYPERWSLMRGVETRR